MKNAFEFMLRALFVLEIFTVLSWLFGYVEKLLDKKDKVNSKIYYWQTRQHQSCKEWGRETSSRPLFVF